MKHTTLSAYPHCLDEVDVLGYLSNTDLYSFFNIILSKSFSYLSSSYFYQYICIKYNEIQFSSVIILYSNVLSIVKPRGKCMLQ